MELDEARKIIEEIREYYLQPVIQRDKRWKTRAEALQYFLALGKSLKEMEGVVPKEKDTSILHNECSFCGKREISYEYGFNTCRSQTLLGLAGFAEKLELIIIDFVRKQPNKILEKLDTYNLAQKILTELKGGREIESR